jgi:hypothetical protein
MTNKEAEEILVDSFMTAELHRKQEKDDDRIVYWYEGTLPDDEMDDIKIELDLHGRYIKMDCEGTKFVMVSGDTLAIMQNIMEFIDVILEKMEDDTSYEPPKEVRINANTFIE